MSRLTRGEFGLSWGGMITLEVIQNKKKCYKKKRNNKKKKKCVLVQSDYGSFRLSISLEGRNQCHNFFACK